MPSLFTFIAALALSAGLCTAVASPELQDIRRMHHQRMRLHRRAGPSATPQPESVIADTSFNGCPYITYQGTPYAANQLFLVYQPDRTATATGVNKLTCIYQDTDLTFQFFCVYDRFGVQTASSDARCGTSTAVQRATSDEGCYGVCPGVSGHPRSDINDVSSSLGDTSQFLRCSYLQSATGTDDDICLWNANTGEAQDSNGPICPSSASLRQIVNGVDGEFCAGPPPQAP